MSFFITRAFLDESQGILASPPAPAETAYSPRGPAVFESLGQRAFPHIPAKFFASLSGITPVFAEAPEKRDPLREYYGDAAGRGRVTAFFGMIVRSEELADTVLANAEAFHIPPALAFALCWEESRFNTRALNRRNSNKTVDRGLFQLNSSSFPDLREEDFFNPATNSYYGLAHLRWCLDTGGSEVAGLAMYNAGTGKVRSGATPKITLDYVSRILENQRRIEDLFVTWNTLNNTLAPDPPPAEPDDPRPEKLPLALLSPSGRP
jgi:hypothetical protein